MSNNSISANPSDDKSNSITAKPEPGDDKSNSITAKPEPSDEKNNSISAKPEPGDDDNDDEFINKLSQMSLGDFVKRLSKLN
jgi:hypothetical protein